MDVVKIKKENLQKASIAVERASEYFRQLGFEVAPAADPSLNGPDLIITKPAEGLEFSVEVKAVGKSQRAWRSRGRHLRTGDDFIAFVFPNGRVYVEDFGTHEKLRCKDGGRHLTKIAKIYA